MFCQHINTMLSKLLNKNCAYNSEETQETLTLFVTKVARNIYKLYISYPKCMLISSKKKLLMYSMPRSTKFSSRNSKNYNILEGWVQSIMANLRLQLVLQGVKANQEITKISQNVFKHKIIKLLIY